MSAESPPLQADWVAPGRTALLVIDAQVDFGLPDGKMGRQGADMRAPLAALENIAALVAAARQAGVEVIFVRYINRPDRESRVAAEARARHGDSPQLCLEGTRGADFAGPRPEAGETVIDKSLFSAFAGTGLEALLKKHGRDTVLLCGLTTECCVQSTAWDGFERDLHVLLAADACAAYAPDLHQGALKALAASGAILGDTRKITAAWKKLRDYSGL